MKEGYIVMNVSNCGDEIFGAYKNLKRAERQLRKVIRNRYGRCPRDLGELVNKPYIEGGDFSYQIIYFVENDGEWK